MKLRKYQKQGVQFLKDRQYALLADDVGLGKTAQAVVAAPNTEEKILVICTATIKQNWVEQIWTWLGSKTLIQTINSSRQPITTITKFIIVNYDLINRKDKKIFHALMGLKYGLIICDEAHKLKNTRAKRTRRVLDSRGLISRTKRMWFLTATPIKNRPIDLYSLLSSTVPHLIKPYNSFLRFAYRYCAAFEDKYGLNVTGASHTGELADRIRPFMLRRTQEDIGEQLPGLNLETIQLECTEEARRIIKEEEMRTLELAGNRDPELLSLGETARIRQALAKYKATEALVFIRNLLEEVDKVVIYFHHTSVLKLLLTSLSDMDPVYINGSVPPSKRLPIVKAFAKKANHRVFIGQIQACGEGLDGLQHSAYTCVFVEPSWSPTDIIQCIGRLKRLGQPKHMVSAYILVIRSTLEAHMMGTARWKEKIINKIVKKTEREENQMYIEERLEKIEKVLVKLSEAVTKLCAAITGQAVEKAHTAVKETAAKTTAKKTTKKSKAKTAEPVDEDEPEDADVEDIDEDEDEDESDINVEDVRKIVRKVIKKLPEGVGHKRCKAIVQALGGKKLDQLTGKKLVKAKAQFEAVLAEDGEDLDV